MCWSSVTLGMLGGIQGEQMAGQSAWIRFKKQLFSQIKLWHSQYKALLKIKMFVECVKFSPQTSRTNFWEVYELKVSLYHSLPLNLTQKKALLI